MASFRPLALVVLGLSLVGVAAGGLWAGLAFAALDRDPQAAIGVALGLVLLAPASLCALGAGLSLRLRTHHPIAAVVILTSTGAVVLVIGLALLTLLLPTVL